MKLILKTLTGKGLVNTFIALIGLIFNVQPSAAQQQSGKIESENLLRQRISINEDWRFFKYDSIVNADNLIYDVRPEVTDNNENKVADSKPTEAVKIESAQECLSHGFYHQQMIL